MSSRRALITGITGQDGSYLAEYLLDLGYTVHGWGHSGSADPDHQWRLQAVADRIHLSTVDLADPTQVAASVQDIQPDECYHLGARSFVADAAKHTDATLAVNVDGTRHLLSALRDHAPRCRVFFAGTSEMFGEAPTAPQNESTPFNPHTLYGVSKLMGHEWVRWFRRHGLFAGTGFLYNHESPRRGPRFVTRKITSAAAHIKLGLERELRLGNLDARRDWGFAGDYVRAMHAALQRPAPEDYVIATGRTHSVREFLECAFGPLNLDYREYVVSDPEFFRPAERVELVGDASKARRDLGWEARLPFGDLVREMVESDLEHCRKLL